MSYLSFPDIRERRTGSTTVEVGEEELELEVSFEYHEWSEGHPYGDTIAYERLSEMDDEEYELEGEALTYDQLVARLGQEAADAAIERAINSAS